MNSQLPSDALSSLKALASTVVDLNGQRVEVNVHVVLALIECAEIVMIEYLLLSSNLRMRALDALTVLEKP